MLKEGVTLVVLGKMNLFCAPGSVPGDYNETAMKG
jgi:hypothetical protein